MCVELKLGQSTYDLDESYDYDNLFFGTGIVAAAVILLHKFLQQTTNS